MSAEELNRTTDAFNVLRQFARRRVATEQCELCSRGVGPDHQHLIEPATRRLMCACDACAVLFGHDGAVYKRVPRDPRRLSDFNITDAQWDGLLIPIDMAFFFKSSPAGRVVAIYPSPAGPTESLLPLDTWNQIVDANPGLRKMGDDVEALLANRVGRSRHETDIPYHPEYYIVPIDECFKLVGLIRLHWKGLSGGTDVWKEINRFFGQLRQRTTREASHA